MIYPSDVRIGNLIYFKEYVNSDFIIDKVSTVYHDQIITEKMDIECEAQEPIPLTPELLEKCGIKKYPQSYYKEPHTIRHSIDEAHRVYSKDKYIVFKQWDDTNWLLYGIGNNEEIFCELYDLDILFSSLHQ